MNKAHIEKTKDGSNTLYTSRFDAFYHSLHGAVQESEHVFLKSGLEAVELKEIRVFEMGLGTGLNAALTVDRCIERGIRLHYTALEKYPLEEKETLGLDYQSHLRSHHSAEIMDFIHSCPWEEFTSFHQEIDFKKLRGDLIDYYLTGPFDLIYYDAFAPAAQAELWSIDMFKKLFDAAAKNAVMTTYCCKGQVRRDMISAGWDVERIEGPPGKRHMLRAFKR